MPTDIDSMAPDAVEYFLGIGRRYATPQVVAQGRKTLHGVAKHRALLAEQGFGPDDEQELVERLDELLAQDTGRAQAAGLRKIIVQACTDEVRNAKQWRKSTRNILTAGLRVLRQTGDEATIRKVQTVLKETRVLGGEENLSKQMQMLYAVLVDAAVLTTVAMRGGVRVQTSYDSVHSALVAAQGDLAAEPPATAAAERRDILDGIVVTLARSARAAAKLVARELGQPSIAAEFALTHLRRSRTATPGAGEPEAPEAPATPGKPARPIGDATP
jgi:hypothetical protein